VFVLALALVQPPDSRRYDLGDVHVLGWEHGALFAIDPPLAVHVVGDPACWLLIDPLVSVARHCFAAAALQVQAPQLGQQVLVLVLVFVLALALVQPPDSRRYDLGDVHVLGWEHFALFAIDPPVRCPQSWSLAPFYEHDVPLDSHLL